MNKQLLIEHIHKYRQTQAESDEQFQADFEERKSCVSYYQSYIKEKILKMTEEEFAEYL